MEAEKVVEKHAVWYAVYTNSRAEKRAGELLLQEGIENYVPIVKVLRQWSDRKKWVEVPLVPGYIFVKTSERKRSKVLAITGVVGFVKFNDTIPEIPDEQIETLKILVESKAELRFSNSNIKKGDRVEILKGPFMGAIGEVISEKGKSVFQLVMTTLGFCFQMDVQREDLNVIRDT